MPGAGVQTISISEVLFISLANDLPAFYEIGAFIVFTIVEIAIPPALCTRLPLCERLLAMRAGS